MILPDRHRSFSQHGLTKAVFGESVFAIDLASISYIEREESPDSRGSSPPCKKRLNYAVKPFFYFPRKGTKKRQKTLCVKFCVNSDVKFVISKVEFISASDIIKAVNRKK